MRRKSELADLDPRSWPTVAHTELSERDRDAFTKRQQAIERYAQGDTIQVIEETIGIDRRELYRRPELCLAQHEDGRPYGFRALIRYQRMVAYTRVTKVNVQGEQGSRGTVGALLQLFEAYPSLTAWLSQSIQQRRIVLEERGSHGRARTRARGLAHVHADFSQQCRTLGLTAADYPFNTNERGIRALSDRIKAAMFVSFGRAARPAGARHLKGLPRSRDAFSAPAATRPFQVVEFDGHRLDVRLKIVVRDPLDFEHEFELERVWLLVIIDVCTRVVLAYHLVLAREYSRYDVIKTVERALEPHKPRKFGIAGLEYGLHGGFASQTPARARLCHLGVAASGAVMATPASA